MNRKWLSVVFVLLLTLMACQTTDNSQQGELNNPNINPTTNRNTGDGMLENQNRMGQQDNLTNRGTGFKNTNDARNGGTDNRMNNQQEDSRYEVANEAAERITDEIGQIERAYVLTTQNNAYVAAQLDAEDNRRNQGNDNRSNNNRGDRESGEELTAEVKKEISDIVRSVDNGIENVYVSTNPDFFNLTNNYADDFGNDKPVRGMFDQIGNMIERIFPQNTTN